MKLVLHSANHPHPNKRIVRQLIKFVMLNWVEIILVPKNREKKTAENKEILNGMENSLPHC